MCCVLAIIVVVVVKQAHSKYCTVLFFLLTLDLTYIHLAVPGLHKFALEPVMYIRHDGSDPSQKLRPCNVRDQGSAV